jgi:carboxypeptidase PM20D1
VKPRIKKAIRYGLAALGLLVAVLVVKAAMLSPPDHDIPPAPDVPAVDADTVAGHMAALVQARTVSLVKHDGSPEPAADPAEFERLHAKLRELYPRVHETLQVEPVATHSRLYRWPGTDPSLPPVLFAAHLDVVPVEPGTEENWTHPAFAGAIEDGFVWGRGAIDDKLGVVGLMDAVESLLAEGYAPKRTVLLAFGHDEEVGGHGGAQQIAARLQERGVAPWFVFDEGGALVLDAIPTLDKPTAFVGVSEKGYASFELVVVDEGGHSNSPPPTGAIGRLARAVVRLEEQQMDTDIRGATGLMLDAIAPHVGLALRVPLANRWLLEPALEAFTASDPAGNPTVRTTTAVTIFEAGVADNVLASRARAVVNFRLLPGDTVADVEAHIREVIGDNGIAISCFGTCTEPSATAPVDDGRFALIEASINQVYPDAVVAPYLVIGGTDARHYQPLAEDNAAYRFLPLRMRPEDRSRLHGTDERIAVQDLEDGVRFYMILLKNSASG